VTRIVGARRGERDEAPLGVEPARLHRPHVRARDDVAGFVEDAAADHADAGQGEVDLDLGAVPHLDRHASLVGVALAVLKRQVAGALGIH
jgi:hypothetical protein